MKQLPKRILSIDVFRAITMLLMIFVNDAAGLREIPDWLGHTAAAVDGMGFSDVIFPAFLFIVGLSLPFAIQTRLEQGSFLNAISYILLRSVALIIMGYFHVNLENYNHELAPISYSIFTILMTFSFFLIWLDYPKSFAKTKKYAIKTIGIVMLLLLAYHYKGGNAQHVEGLKPHWWGILGLIGWAYLFAAITYLFICFGSRLRTARKITLFTSKENSKRTETQSDEREPRKVNEIPYDVLAAFLMFALVNIASHLGWLTLNLWIIGDASSITLMMGGVFVSIVYERLVATQKSKNLMVIFTAFGLCCLAFGHLIRPFAGGISKIYATPAWVFICLGISVLTFQLLVYIVDFHKKNAWFKWIDSAGTSTLTCYLMPYVIYSVFGLFNFEYPHYLNIGIWGLFRSMAFAFLVVQLVKLLEKQKIRLSI